MSQSFERDAVSEIVVLEWFDWIPKKRLSAFLIYSSYLHYHRCSSCVTRETEDCVLSAG